MEIFCHFLTRKEIVLRNLGCFTLTQPNIVVDSVESKHSGLMFLWESGRVPNTLMSLWSQWTLRFSLLNEECFLYVTFWSTSRKWSVKVQSTGEASASYLTPCGAIKVKPPRSELTGGRRAQLDQPGGLFLLEPSCVWVEEGGFAIIVSAKKKSCFLLNYLIVISDNEKTDFIVMNTHCSVCWSLC